VEYVGVAERALPACPFDLHSQLGHIQHIRAVWHLLVHTHTHAHAPPLTALRTYHRAASEAAVAEHARTAPNDSGVVVLTSGGGCLGEAEVEESLLAENASARPFSCS
jgi:hypothetical protein